MKIKEKVKKFVEDHKSEINDFAWYAAGCVVGGLAVGVAMKLGYRNYFFTAWATDKEIIEILKNENIRKFEAVLVEHIKTGQAITLVKKGVEAI